ncbi:glycoproteinglycoprotein-like-like [Podarcis lilfordi]|uniref:Glycoproteinglycoprotein-like-like n=1 Tax=Podarcis lilfordi TaxID=74358 RepID=A0AA35KA18_9SAUR|nr:glycoproteinglycoprotein-like-like [Podarcis lilfordi]
MARRPRRLLLRRRLVGLLAGVSAMLLLPLLQAGRSCPSCFCFATPDTVQCRYVRLLEPPDELPRAVHNLSIVGGNLTVLRTAAFAGGWARGEPLRPLGNLTLLVLTHNHIETLEEATFAGLPALATLDLSHNPLRSVAPGAFASCARLRTLRLNQALLAPGAPPFAELLDGALLNLSLVRLELAGNRLRQLPAPWALPPGLEELDLRNNSLRALRSERLDGLAALGRVRLLLDSNPLHCDCASLRPLLLWLRNATWRAPGVRRLRCASPPQLRDRLLWRLRLLQLECLDGSDWALLEPGGSEEEEMETASYVFFGIVLALIGVVFLMVLYLNRKGIKRWLSNLREACRDQMEGYHYRYEQDSDPRRASPGDL